MKSDSAKVVVVGGGIVGCSVLYWLARKGWTDVILLEREELTSGSTWQAAGNITHFGHFAELAQLYADTLTTYLEAEEESGQSVGFHKTGSLRFATTQAELDAYKSLEPLYETLGVPYRVVSADEVGRLNPLVKTDGLFGAAYTPADGHVDPSGATHAMAGAASARGSEIRRHSPARSIAREDSGMWRVDTEAGSILAEHVVLAASFWTRRLTAQLGLTLPLYAFEHQEIVTGDVPILQSLDREIPTVRDPAGPSNVRQERQTLLCGVYEDKPVLWADQELPSALAGETGSPDMGRLEKHLLRVMERMPAFGEVGIKTVNSGPLCFPPDGCPLVGPLNDHSGLWMASGFQVGIGTGGGSGKHLADWMVHGKPAYDLPMIDPNRFDMSMTPQGCLAQMKATYAEGYVLPK